MSVDDFSVFVQTRAPGGERVDPGQEFGKALTDAVAPYRGVCSVGEHGWDARVSVDAEDAVVAGAVGAALVRTLASRSGAPEWPVVRVDAMRGDVLHEEASRAL